MSLDGLLVASAQDATPLHAMKVAEYKTWIKKQSASLVHWLEAQDFKPKAGRHLLLPAKDGTVGGVLACLSDPVSLWDLAALSRALPKGTYALEADLDEEEEEKLALGWMLGGYGFDAYKKEKKPAKAKLCVGKKAYLSSVKAMADATAKVRDWINIPASDMTPKALVQAVSEAAKEHGAKVRITSGDALLTHHYPAIHAVGRASVHAPQLACLEWGAADHPLVALVGKGVCFDTGGLDMKPPGAMYLMRKDMAGAAVALGLAIMIMQSKLPVRLRLWIPAVENAIGGDAFRPSDILTMRDGTTVEVGNTDAEGRLVMADCLAEALDEKPDLLIDFSTLTGAARSALGAGISAYFTPDDDLAHALDGAAKETEDPVWRMPLFDGYRSMLDSGFADIHSCPSSPYAGAITAALFLQHFTGKLRNWIHFDFMGWNLSSKPGRPEGGEAMLLRAVYRLLCSRYGATR